jgi:hypothetical protein
MLIDAYAEGWLDELDSFAAAHQASGNTVLLLDGAFVPGIHKQFSRALSADDGLAFLFQELPGWRDAVRDVSPFVIKYEIANPQLKQALEKCGGWPMVSAICTTEPVHAIAQRLARWCVVQAAGQHINLRFPDTRRLADICGVLTDEQRADMFGPAKHCIYMRRNGKWGRIALDGIAPPLDMEPKLTGLQFDKLLEFSEGDSILAQLEGRSAIASGMSRSSQYDSVCAALGIGKAKNLDRRDLVNWCEFSLTSAAPDQTKSDLFAIWHSEQTANQVG